MGVFNDPNICYRDNTEGHEKFRRFLECVNEKFPIEVIEDPTRRGVILGLVQQGGADGEGGAPVEPWLQ